MGLLSGYQESTFAYHSTPRENAASIRTNGLRQDAAKQTDSTDIIDILAELGYSDPFQFDRGAVTYCHVDAAYVESVLQPHDDSALTPDDVVVIVDVSELDVPMYLADMSIITDLIDYRYAGVEQMMYADTPDEVVDLYRESITEVEGPETIEAYDNDSTHTELVVDGDIPPTAIAAVRDPQDYTAVNEQ